MSFLAQIEWRQPAWWLLALLPLAFALWERLRRRRKLAYAEAHLLPWAVSRHTASVRTRWHRAAYFVAWWLVAGAAAGPRFPLVSQEPGKSSERRHNADLVVALDVSSAMLAAGASSARLAPAKLALLDLLERLHGERLGLVVYSKGAGLLMPLSGDYGAFRYYLNLADTGLLAGSGEDIGAAIDLARTSLSGEKNRAAKAVLLIIDSTRTNLSGEPGSQARAAAGRLKQAGMPLYVLELGAIADADGLLADLASDTGGRLAKLGYGVAPWSQLYDNGMLTLAAPAAPSARPHAWQELYAWLLVPAATLLCFLFYPSAFLRRRIVRIAAIAVAFVLAGFGLTPQPARAADDIPGQAYAAYRKGDYGAAQMLYGQLQGYPALMGEGAAAYRRRQYAIAVNRFTAALLAANPAQRADALFNLGNSHFLVGNVKAAADAYADVLRYRPHDAGAQTNLVLAQQKLAVMAGLDAYSAGILARGASRRGTGFPQDNGKLPPTETMSGAIGAQPAVPRDGTSLERALAPSSPVDGRQGTAARLRSGQYDAALKKLELLQDDPQAMQKALMTLQAGQGKYTGGAP